MSRKLTLALSGMAAVVGMLATPASATVYNDHPEKSYLVTVGKVTVPVHMVPARETVHMRSAGRASSSGRFVDRGKSRVWVPHTEAEEARPSRVTDTSETKTPPRGRFIQQGKATIWVSE